MFLLLVLNLGKSSQEIYVENKINQMTRRAASASEDGGGPLLYHVYQASVNVSRTVLSQGCKRKQIGQVVLAPGAYVLDTNVCYQIEVGDVKVGKV